MAGTPNGPDFRWRLWPHWVLFIATILALIAAGFWGIVSRI